MPLSSTATVPIETRMPTRTPTARGTAAQRSPPAQASGRRTARALTRHDASHEAPRGTPRGRATTRMTSGTARQGNTPGAPGHRAATRTAAAGAPIVPPPGAAPADLTRGVANPGQAQQQRAAGTAPPPHRGEGRTRKAPRRGTATHGIGGEQGPAEARYGPPPTTNRRLLPGDAPGTAATARRAHRGRRLPEQTPSSRPWQR